MKTIASKLLVLAFILTFSSGASWCAQPPSPPANAGTHERAELKVLKVFAARDGEAIFRAYLVEWKGQEVVAEDRLVKTDHKVGETVSILVMRMPFPQGKESYDLLHFSVLTPPPIKAKDANKVGRG